MQHQKDFPDIAKVRCHCHKKHSPQCGCFTPKFLVQARKNFNCCLKQAGKSAASFALRMQTLGKYHARDIHQWESGKPYKVCTCGKCKDKITCEGKLCQTMAGECGFHPDRKCTCGECGEDETKCDGEPYHSKHPLTCPFHALAYEIECTTRASQAKQLVHPELGSATSNILEASHNVFIRYRPKSLSLSRVHYMVSTNLGLLQSNLSYMIEKHGVKYHWLLDLFKRLKLPIFDGMKEGLEKANRDRLHRLAFKKTERAKKRRIEIYQSRDKEQKARSKWAKKQKIQHDYGTNIMVEESHDSKAPVGQKRCKCNSTSHLRTNHSECPLNPKRKRNASAVSGHAMSCDREETSPTRVTPPSQDEDSSESDWDETSPTREMSPLQSEASSDLECIENSDVCDSESENSSDSESDSEPDSEMEIISFSKAVSVCTCGATGAGRVSHRRNCPCNPRNVTLQGTSSSGPAYTVTGPLPTVEWKDLALNRLSSLAGVSAINKIRSPDPLKPVPCREIAPHIRDVVRGDGHCFFRALSKELTGTEDNHLLIRRAITSFMVIPENEVILARYCNVESMARHVSQKQIDKDGWATEVEIHVMATILQCEIYVFCEFGPTRSWSRFTPAFSSSKGAGCMDPCGYKIYLYHTECRTHYDHVVPQL